MGYFTKTINRMNTHVHILKNNQLRNTIQNSFSIPLHMLLLYSLFLTLLYYYYTTNAHTKNVLQIIQASQTCLVPLTHTDCCSGFAQG